MLYLFSKLSFFARLDAPHISRLCLRQFIETDLLTVLILPRSILPFVHWKRRLKKKTNMTDYFQVSQQLGLSNYSRQNDTFIPYGTAGFRTKYIWPKYVLAIRSLSIWNSFVNILQSRKVGAHHVSHGDFGDTAFQSKERYAR